MSPFGFTPDDGSEQNPNEMTPEQLAAMLAQMQEQVTEQFQKLGINPAGFINPFSAGAESLPKSIVRDTAKKIISTAGSLPVGNTDSTVVAQASSIAQLWLNEATDFAPITSATRTLSRWGAPNAEAGIALSTFERVVFDVVFEISEDEEAAGPKSPSTA